MAQKVKRLPAMQETHVRSLGWEDSLEKGMANHSNILPGILWTKEPGRLQSMEPQRVGPNRVKSTSMIITNLHLHLLKLISLFLFPR